MYSMIISICIGVLIAVAGLIGIDIAKHKSKNLKLDIIAIFLIFSLVIIAMTEL